jgi:hypothetical protein
MAAQRSAIIMGDPLLMGKMQDAMAATVRGLQQEASGADASVARVMAQAASLNMGDPKVRATQDAELANVQAQRTAVYDRLNRAAAMQMQYSPQGAGLPGAGNAPPASGTPPNAAAFLPKPPAGSAAARAPTPAPAAGPRPGLLNNATPAPSFVPQ